MQDHQIRIATVLASLLAILLLVKWGWKAPKEDLDKDATDPVWQVKSTDIVKVDATRPDGKLVLEKKADGHWYIDEPIQDVASDKQVGYLLDELARVTKGIPVPKGKASDFGLGDPPEVTITVTLKDGTTKTLDVGTKAPVGWRTYVRDAKGGVAAVSGEVGQRFESDVDELRSKAVMRFDPADVRGVSIAGKSHTLDVHGQGKHWWLEGFTRADPDKVDDLVTGLLDIRFDTFYKGKDPAPHGIGNPTWKVTVTLAKGGSVGFDVGEDAPTGALVRTFSGRTGWVDPKSLALLGQGPRDIGDPHAFPLDKDEDDHVDVHLGDMKWKADRDGEHWKAEGESQDAVDKAVAALADVPIHYQADPVPALTADFGKVTITQDGQPPEVVDVGQVVEDKYRAAQDEGGGEPYLVPVDKLTDKALALQ